MQEKTQKKVSLILTTYNCLDCFKKTIRTIEKQDYPNVEVCIADGCSTDGTLEAVKEYAATSKYTVVYQSKKDSGIYDGINNAIKLSSGDYLEIMNDEYTCENAITKLVDAIEVDDNRYVGAHADLAYCENGIVKRNWIMGNGLIYSGWMPAHPTLMLKREVYEQYGYYSTDYICSADYEFMLRFLKDKKKVAYVPERLVSMFYGGTSTATAGDYFTSVKEAIRALHDNKVPFALWITFLRTVRVLLQFAKGGK